MGIFRNLGIGKSLRAGGVAALIAFAGADAAKANADRQGTWSWAVQGGLMTDGRAPDAIRPNRLTWTDDYMVGLVLGYHRRIADTRLSFGVEVQANVHLGRQTFYELAVPLSVRYHPARSWGEAFDSFAFGLGYSHYSEISELERENYDGQSRKGLIYWYLEVEFAELAPGDNLFLRLHHRSNGFGTLEPNGGSNAWVLGFRRAF